MDSQNHLSVQDTNQEALASKISAIRKGYFTDPYAEQFAAYKGNRDILMHRGYWARVHIVKTLVHRFLDSSQNLPVQIISLGCGLQTLWFNLKQDEKYRNKDLRFIQLDLPSVIQKKSKKIKNSKLISNLINKLNLTDSKQIAEDHSYLKFGKQYSLASCDLSDLNQFKSVLNSLNIDNKIPTLFYCQCVLSYIQPQPIDNLLKYIHQSFRINWIFDYQMYNPYDRFGKMMVKNFQERGCPLIGINKYPLLQDQNKRFKQAGYKQIQLDSMNKIYYNYIDKGQRIKIEKLEFLDQLEEWNIIMGHYFGVVAHNCSEYVDEDIERRMADVVKMNQQN